MLCCRVLVSGSRLSPTCVRKSCKYLEAEGVEPIDKSNPSPRIGADRLSTVHDALYHHVRCQNVSIPGSEIRDILLSLQPHCFTRPTMNVMWSRNWSRPLAVRYGAAAILCMLCLGLFLHTITGVETKSLKPELRRLIESRNDAEIMDSEHASPDIGIVMAKTRPEDVNWLLELHEDLPF